MLDCSVLDSIASEILQIRHQSGVQRAFTFAKDPTRIDALRRQLAEALQNFHVSGLVQLTIVHLLNCSRQLETAIDNSRVLASLNSVNVIEVIERLTVETAAKIGTHSTCPLPEITSGS